MAPGGFSSRRKQPGSFLRRGTGINKGRSVQLDGKEFHECILMSNKIGERVQEESRRRIFISSFMLPLPSCSSAFTLLFTEGSLILLRKTKKGDPGPEASHSQRKTEKSQVAFSKERLPFFCAAMPARGAAEGAEISTEMAFLPILQKRILNPSISFPFPFTRRKKNYG